MTTVVTGWTGRSYDALGEHFVRTFKQHWPKSIRLTPYVDGDYWTTFAGRYDGVMNPLDARTLHGVDGLAEFIARHKDSPRANGREPNKRWKPKEVAAGYSFRFDAVRFATQLFIPEAAAKHLADGEIMVWFDADVVTTADVPEGFIGGLIGDADLCYLGREPKHSEIGFWAVRLNGATRKFLTALAETYRSDSLFENLAEWHSAFVFDACRNVLHAEGGRERNLTPGGRGHVWLSSPLHRHAEHRKGDRKWRKAA